MSSKKNHSSSKEVSDSEQGSEELVVIDASEDSQGLDSEAGLVASQVSEVAKENASEQSKGGQGQGSKTVQDQKKKEEHLDERMLLRERLLENAPNTPLMRREVESVLLTKKSRLESSIGKLNRGKEYELLSRTIAELRQVVHQIELVAHASYELLKDIWLRVVHKFA